MTNQLRANGGTVFKAISERLMLKSNADVAFADGAERMLRDKKLKKKQKEIFVTKEPLLWPWGLLLTSCPSKTRPLHIPYLIRDLEAYCSPPSWCAFSFAQYVIVQLCLHWEENKLKFKFKFKTHQDLLVAWFYGKKTPMISWNGSKTWEHLGAVGSIWEQSGAVGAMGAGSNFGSKTSNMIWWAKKAGEYT